MMDVAPQGGASFNTPLGYVHDIQLDPPVLGNNLADVQRLEQALKKKWSTDQVHIPWEMTQNLSRWLREWDFKARALVFKDRRSWRLVELFPPDHGGPVLGAAVDIGTTRIVLSLVDLATGQVLGERGLANPQGEMGIDVLARIHHSRRPGGLDALQTAVVSGVNRSLATLCAELGYGPGDVYLLTGAGNTVMTHLFLGLDPWEIIREPYIPCTNVPNTLYANRLGSDIHPRGLAFLFPNIGSYFGGDLLAGILFSDLDQGEAPALMVDVGTNAEIVIGSRDWLWPAPGPQVPPWRAVCPRWAWPQAPE